MKKLLLTVFISLSTGISCSINPKEISKKEVPSSTKTISESDKNRIPEKEDISIEKQTQENNTHLKLKKTSQKKQTSVKDPFLKHSENKPEGKNLKESTSREMTKIIKVHGMVCAFCSNSIEKKFKKQKAVKSVNVNLESKKVTLVLKSREVFPDEEIKKIITASGFHPISIENKKMDSKQDSKK